MVLGDVVHFVLIKAGNVVLQVNGISRVVGPYYGNVGPLPYPHVSVLVGIE